LAGAAPPSCSDAGVAFARLVFPKGAHFTPAMTFERASTNLVVEFDIIIAVFIGWQLTLGSSSARPLMIALLVLLQCFLSRDLIDRGEAVLAIVLSDRSRFRIIQPSRLRKPPPPLSLHSMRRLHFIGRGEWAQA
jgi:Predicted permease